MGGDTDAREPTGKVPGCGEGSLGGRRRLRDAGGLYFNAGNVSERFLFYEATAFRDTTVSATVTGRRSRFAMTHFEASGQVIVLVNTADKHFVEGGGGD